MFRCEKTGKLSAPGESSRKLVTKTRRKEYFRTDPKTGEQVKSGEGWEIVEELTVCQEAYDAAMSSQGVTSGRISLSNARR